jgi:hypothetical protein
VTDRFHVRRFVITTLRLHVVWVYPRFKGTESIKNIEGFLDGKLTPGYCKDLLRKIWKADWAPKVGAPAADNSNSKKRSCPFVCWRTRRTRRPPSRTSSRRTWALSAPRRTLALSPGGGSTRARSRSVAHMARTFLGCPASTAGLERFFCRAGRMHNAQKKTLKEGTLEMKMLASLTKFP